MSQDAGALNQGQAGSTWTQARREAFLQRLSAVLGVSEQQATQRAIDDIRHALRLNQDAYRGLQQVPVEKIIGSVGRYSDFSRTFLPQTSDMQARWQRVVEAQPGSELPPVELYKVGDAYFVKDGKHRVSVARQLGLETIDAYVWEYPKPSTDTGAQAGMDELIVAAEYRAFLDRTQLTTSHPEAELILSEPGTYATLELEIELYREKLALTTGQPRSYPEAAAAWYGAVYMPAIAVIRESNALEEAFQGRTEADLYVWAVRHNHELNQQYGIASEPELAVEESAPPPPAAPAPAPKTGSAARRERAVEKDSGSGTPTPPDASERDTAPPEFTAFYPQVVKPAQAYALMVFAHSEAARGTVREIASGYKQMMDGAQASDSTPSKLSIDPGSLITIVPQMDGITFEPAEQVIAWQPPHVSATFLFTTPAQLDRDLTGRVLVYHGPLIAGEIPITPETIQHAPGKASTPPTQHQEAAMRAFDPIFASYSHRDTPVMEYFRRTRENMGQKMLVDIYDLRTGEHWADRLLEMIDQSAVFQLFWSANSARSQYCRQEWEHALQYIDQRPRFVQPVYWSAPGPTPEPPPKLAELHFQRVTLPPLTRVQMVLAKVRQRLRGG